MPWTGAATVRRYGVNESDEFSVGVLEDEVDDYTVSSSFGLGIRVQKDGRERLRLYRSYG